VNPVLERIQLGLVPPAAYAYIRLVRATSKLAYRGREVLDDARRAHGKYILAFWHSRYVMMPYSYPGPKLTVLISHHRDSEMLGRLLARFGLDVSRGSSTRGGVAGMRDVLRKVAAGYDFGIAPDGPKGPRRLVKPGVIAAARIGGLPIVPVAYSASPAWRLRSWDRTLVPRPFARGLFVYGRTLVVPREADEAAQEGLRAELETELDRVTDLADSETGIGREEPWREEGP
jgi:lysophospholipid acyltransferase (LPLAT)-like uncharacterized protein